MAGRHYFCIFCHNMFDNDADTLDHYLEHLTRPYFCPKCDAGEECSVDHSHELETNVTEEQAEASNTWVTRLIQYQKLNPLFKELAKNSKKSDACPVCDTYKCVERVPSHLPSEETSLRFKKMIDEVRTECGESQRNSLVKHVYSHLKYFPMVCTECPKSPRKVFLEEMMKHVMTEHGKVDTMIAAYRKIRLELVPKLESYIKDYLKRHANINHVSSITQFQRDNPGIDAPPAPVLPATTLHILSPVSRPSSSSEFRRSSNESATSSASARKTPKRKKRFSLDGTEWQGVIRECHVVLYQMTREEMLSYDPSYDELGTDEEGELELEEMGFEDIMIQDQPPISQKHFFCVFCLMRFINKSDAEECLFAHLNYYPICCCSCEEVFVNIRKLGAHIRENHGDQPKGRYTRSSNRNIERWVNRLLNSQINPEPTEGHNFCLVCHHFDYEMQSLDDSRVDYNHIYKHLCYVPFECQLCLEKGMKTALSVVAKKAKKHISKKHRNRAQMIEETGSSVFEKTGRIPMLEQLIEKFIEIKEENNLKPVEKQSEGSGLKKSKRKRHRLASGGSASSSHSGHHRKSSGSKRRKSSTPVSPPKKRRLSESFTTSKSEVKKKLGDQGIDGGGHREGGNRGVHVIVNDVGVDDNDILAELNQQSNEKLEMTERRLVGPLISPEENGGAENSLLLKKKEKEKEVEVIVKKMEPKMTPIPCIFCEMDFEKKEQAFGHYLNHLGCKPCLVCGVCERTFKEPEEFRIHCQDHPESRQVPFKRKINETAGRWTQEFLTLLESSRFRHDPDFGELCPVCMRLPGAQPDIRQNSAIKQVLSHIFRHLAYNSFECIQCDSNRKRPFINNIADEGRVHLKDEHDMMTFSGPIDSYFKDGIKIPFIEEFVAKFVNERVAMFQTQPTHDEIMGEISETESNNNSVQVKCEDDNGPSLSASNSNTGSDDNLTKPNIVSSETEKAANNTIALNEEDESTTDSMNAAAKEERNVTLNESLNSQPEKSVICKYCNESFERMKLLRRHCRSKHPNLPILAIKASNPPPPPPAFPTESSLGPNSTDGFN